VARPKTTEADRRPARRPLLDRRRLRHLGLAAAGVLTFVVFVASSTTFAMLALAEGQKDEYTEKELPTDPSPDDPLKPINVVILGSDTREGLSEEDQESVGTPEMVGGQRSDTLILAQFDPRKDHATLVHFPRDLLVSIPGHGDDKVNAAFTLGGPKLTLSTLRQLTGMRIHHYIEVNFKGFREIVDALDGVEICVDRPMIDPMAQLHLPEAGCYPMDGDTALAFVRARNVEGDEIPDFARIARQQQFIRAVINEVFSPGTLTRLPALVSRAADAVKTDAGLTVTDLVRYARELQGIAAEDPSAASAVDLRIVPSTHELIGGISYVVPTPDAQALFRRLREGRPLGDIGRVAERTPPSPAQIAVRVVSAGEPEIAEAVKAQVRGAGFIFLGIEQTAPARSEIVFSPGFDQAGQVVAGFFDGLPAREGTARELRGADVVIVVGRGFPEPAP
jgi:LCP family protein required for cell wall assembly